MLFIKQNFYFSDFSPASDFTYYSKLLLDKLLAGLIANMMINTNFQRCFGNIFNVSNKLSL